MNLKNVILVLGASALLASCNKEENAVVDQVSDRTVTLRLSAEQTTTRAVEKNIGTVTPEIKDVTLYFYSSEDGISLETRILNGFEVELAQGAGLPLSVPGNVQYVSMAGNEALTANDILHYQGLNSDGNATAFKRLIPLLSARTPITTTAAGASVVLKPMAQLARIEVSGSINTVPADNSAPTYEYAKVSGVFCNNYKLRSDAADYQLYKKSNVAENFQWALLPDKMKDLLGDAERLSLAATGADKRCAAYKVFPANGIESLPHIVLEVVYKKMGSQTEQTGYFTINRYRTPNDTAFMTAMKGGYIYKLDISGLSSKFQKAQDPNTGVTIDPTDREPEMDKAELVVTVEPVEWTEQAIVPGI